MSRKAPIEFADAEPKGRADLPRDSKPVESVRRSGADPRPAAVSRIAVASSGALIVLAAILAYANSFSGLFIFDDPDAILDNPTIRHLSNLGAVLAPPQGMTVSGRPLLNLSLAINHAISGDKVWSYHALNLLIHTLGGLTLFGLIRRTLQLPKLRPVFGAAALPISLAASLLWTLHPVQTEAVTYTVQRAESLMGLFYLLTLYCFVRAVSDAGATAVRVGNGSSFWSIASVVSCVCGMATKEVMVSAPLLVLLYDRTFVSSDFRDALRRRGRYFAGLALTYVPLLYFVLSTGGNRGGSAGFDVGVSPLAYWLTQCEAIVHYLKLALWPHPLVFEYGVFDAGGMARVLPFAAVVSAIVIMTVVGLWRSSILGYLGTWFCCILAPTSLVPGTTQMIVEHRMYLALVPALVLLTALAFRWCGRRGLGACFLLGLSAAGLTLHRNFDYATDVSIWADTAIKRPGNPLAHYALGNALLGQGRAEEAIPRFEAALRLKPDYADAHYNFGNALLRLEKTEAAAERYRAAIRLNPQLAAAHNNLGNLLVRNGQTAEGKAEIEKALRIDPSLAEAHYALGNAYKASGSDTEAIAEYEATVRLAPEHFKAHNNLGNLLLRLGRVADAIPHFEAALQVQPSNAMLHVNLGNAFLAGKQWENAKAQYEAALRLEPANAAAREGLSRLPPR